MMAMMMRRSSMVGHQGGRGDPGNEMKGGKRSKVMVINATGKGAAEVLARAWCSERGRSAVVRRKGGLVLSVRSSFENTAAMCR